jgi:hypothetical protein
MGCCHSNHWQLLHCAAAVNILNTADIKYIHYIGLGDCDVASNAAIKYVAV